MCDLGQFQPIKICIKPPIPDINCFDNYLSSVIANMEKSKLLLFTQSQGLGGVYDVTIYNARSDFYLHPQCS